MFAVLDRVMFARLCRKETARRDKTLRYPSETDEKQYVPASGRLDPLHDATGNARSETLEVCGPSGDVGYEIEINTWCFRARRTTWGSSLSLMLLGTATNRLHVETGELHPSAFILYD